MPFIELLLVFSKLNKDLPKVCGSCLLSGFWQRGFEAQWLSLTFSKAVFLGNGLAAIVSGLVANLLADTLSLGPVSPFDTASCVLALGMAIILYTWSENYGDASEGRSLVDQFKAAASTIASGNSLGLYLAGVFIILH